MKPLFRLIVKTPLPVTTRQLQLPVNITNGLNQVTTDPEMIQMTLETTMTKTMMKTSWTPQTT